MILRQYQSDLIDRTRASLKSGKRAPLLVSPCGSGKTVMFSYFAKRVTERGKRTLILAHRSELIDQISRTLMEFSVRHALIVPGSQYNSDDKVHVASVFSVVRKLSKINAPDIIIIDEAHHAIKGSTWGKVLDAYPSAWRIGVTASPVRLSGESLGDIFDDMVVGPSVKELIAIGALCKYRIFAPSTINTSGVHLIGGDFNKKELSFAANKPHITGDAIREYRSHADGKRALVFCVGIDHARDVAAQFAANGYRSACLDGKLSKEVRADMVASFRKGEINVLTSCEIVSEGFDLPAIEVAILLRPTSSLGVFIQQTGRALRPFDGKVEAIILDHAGNTMRHGLPCEDREWSLEGKARRKISGDDEDKISVRICPKCFAASVGNAIACSYCGHVFEIKPREINQVEGSLEEINPEALRRSRMRMQGQAQSLQDLIDLGRSRGYRRPEAWAHFVFQARQSRRLSGVGS